MQPRDVFELIVLAALWGGSFLFMRVAVPDFGPIPLMFVRVGIASLVLIGALGARGGLRHLRPAAGRLLVVGILNSALPFSLFAYATLSVTAGFAAVLNATTPLLGALVAWVWLRERLSGPRVLGLAIGMAGVVVLVWGRTSFRPGGSGMAIVAALAASLSYAIAASFTKRRLTGIDPVAVACGSMIGATLVLAPFAWMTWPGHLVSAIAWTSVVAMGVASTGIAYAMYFRLIARIGPSRAISVTFLVPVFAILFGALFLDERLTSQMAAGAAIVLVGIALATGFLHPPISLGRTTLRTGLRIESAVDATDARTDARRRGPHGQACRKGSTAKEAPCPSEVPRTCRDGPLPS